MMIAVLQTVILVDRGTRSFCYSGGRCCIGRSRNLGAVLMAWDQRSIASANYEPFAPGQFKLIE